MSRVRDIQRRFLESRGWRARFSPLYGWVWTSRCERTGKFVGTSTRSQAFTQEFRNTSQTTRRELRNRLTSAF